MRNRMTWAFAGAGSTMLAMLLAHSPHAASAQAHELAQQDANSRMAARRTPVVEVFEGNRDAVVNISSKEIVTQRDPFGFDSIFQDFFDAPGGPPGMGGGGGGGGRQFTRTSVGSGFVIHPDGFIVTNAHVVAQTAERKAIFSDGKEYDAQIVAFDTERDLAILKIQADKPLPVIKLGRSNDLMIGETVIAIGNPVGLQNTVTAGVISATDRQLDFAQGQSLKGLIQTDASINRGNSGGPLLNVLGELIGVNSAIRNDARNIGFAIPVDQLREELPELLDVERRNRVNDGLDVDTLGQPRITHVEADSPAAKAGVRVGDVVQSVDGKPVHEGIDYAIALLGARAQQSIDLGLTRDGKTINAKLTLDGRPMPDGGKLALDHFGMGLEAVTPETAAALGFPQGVRGLVVTQLENDGPAGSAGIQLRDVVIAIGRHTVESMDDLSQMLEYVDPGETLPVTVLRVDGRMKMRLSGELKAR